jgi:Zn-dependent M28 family amino/carboxypeptidase
MEWTKLILCFFAVILVAFVVFFGKKEAKGNIAFKRIKATRMMENIKVLSSNEYEGRSPASKGEALTTQYIEEQFKKIGLKPGNPDGTYFQNVPMVGIKADPDASLVFTSTLDGKREALQFANDFVACTKREAPAINIDTDIVFVGYGTAAPEYQWDDFKDVDVKNKIIVVLINDPPVPDPKDPSKLDENTFKGKAMTYYGRWTYKFEEAAARGSLGCLIVHQTDPAGYPWAVVRSSNTGELFSLVSADRGMSRCAMEGWITYEKAKALFAMAGKDFDELARQAISRDFRPVDLQVKGSLSLRNTIRIIQSKNVVGKCEGSDSKVCDEYVIYTAHWDHLGIGPEVNGDKIYHGAIDNASGIAGLVELADSFIHAKIKSSRPILFLAVTGEEKGLLGSEYYSEHPLYPLDKTLAEINVDGVNVWGRTRDIEVIGLGQSTLDDDLQLVADEQGRIIKPDSSPEKGYYYRADHFSFAKKGVPAIYPTMGMDYIGKPSGWGKQMHDKYISEDYHRPSDTIKPYWDLRGTVADLHFLGELGYRIANAKTFPEWKPGSEFKSKRDLR